MVKWTILDRKNGPRFPEKWVVKWSILDRKNGPRFPEKWVVKWTMLPGKMGGKMDHFIPENGPLFHPLIVDQPN